MLHVCNTQKTSSCPTGSPADPSSTVYTGASGTKGKGGLQTLFSSHQRGPRVRGPLGLSVPGPAGQAWSSPSSAPLAGSWHMETAPSRQPLVTSLAPRPGVGHCARGCHTFPAWHCPSASPTTCAQVNPPIRLLGPQPPPLSTVTVRGRRGERSGPRHRRAGPRLRIGDALSSSAGKPSLSKEGKMNLQIISAGAPASPGPPNPLPFIRWGGRG